MRLSLLVAALAALPAAAQTGVVPPDLASPEAVVQAAYEAIEREPGGVYDWDRNRTLFLDQALEIPSTEQSGGKLSVYSPAEFMWIVDARTPVGGPRDRGFQEEQTHAVVHRYGDVAQVFSTYQKRFWDSDQVLARGINSFQLVRHDGRWWIVGIAWDEEYNSPDHGGGPIPDRYVGS